MQTPGVRAEDRLASLGGLLQRQAGSGAVAPETNSAAMAVSMFVWQRSALATPPGMCGPTALHRWTQEGWRPKEGLIAPDRWVVFSGADESPRDALDRDQSSDI